MRDRFNRFRFPDLILRPNWQVNYGIVGHAK